MMRDAWDGICNAYLHAFCERHGWNLSDAYWGNDEPGTVACIGGYFVEMDVIRYDVDNDVPADQFWKWYDYTLDICEIETDFRYYGDYRKIEHVSYQKFCEGEPLPYSPEEIGQMRADLDALIGPVDRGEEYVRVMSDLAGVDVMSNTRREPVSWPRYMVMYQMRKDGLTFKRIGDFFGKNHATVVHGVGVVKDMLTMPRMYPTEIRLWQQFQKSIRHE